MGQQHRAVMQCCMVCMCGVLHADMCGACVLCVSMRGVWRACVVLVRAGVGACVMHVVEYSVWHMVVRV